jgi:hypothetical protein
MSNLEETRKVAEEKKLTAKKLLSAFGKANLNPDAFISGESISGFHDELTRAHDVCSQLLRDPQLNSRQQQLLSLKLDLETVLGHLKLLTASHRNLQCTIRDFEVGVDKDSELELS